jgi:hypothetical protein
LQPHWGDEKTDPSEFFDRSPEREALRKKFAEARKSREGNAWDLNGNEVPAAQVKLPAVL